MEGKRSNNKNYNYEMSYYWKICWADKKSFALDSTSYEDYQQRVRATLKYFDGEKRIYYMHLRWVTTLGKIQKLFPNAQSIERYSKEQYLHQQKLIEAYDIEKEREELAAIAEASTEGGSNDNSVKQSPTSYTPKKQKESGKKKEKSKSGENLSLKNKIVKDEEEIYLSGTKEEESSNVNHKRGHEESENTNQSRDQEEIFVRKLLLAQAITKKLKTEDD